MKLDLPRFLKLRERQVLQGLLPPTQAKSFAIIALRYYAKFGVTPPQHILDLLERRGVEPLVPR